MDILSQYEKQNQQPIQMAPQKQPTPEYGFFIRLVMRLSSGRIQNSRQASYVLLGVAILIIVLSIIIFIYQGGSNSRPPPPGEVISSQGEPPHLRIIQTP